MLVNYRCNEPEPNVLPFVPRRFEDETLWSWITRVALYYGWTVDDFLSTLTDEDEAWDGQFRDPDVDVDPPRTLLARLAEATRIPMETIQSWRMKRSPSLLWMDDRTAFCPACFSSPGCVPYVRSVWLDAWTVDCEIHRRPLISIRRARRPWRLPDWSAAWGAERGWALAANVRRRPREEGTKVEIPPTLNPIRHRRITTDEDFPTVPIHVGQPQSELERELVLMAGLAYSGFSIARSYYGLEEDFQWRNSPKGFDAKLPVTEPLGALSLRAGAIVIGSALFDLLTGTAVRDPDTANPLRRQISELHGRPRHWLISKVMEWPLPRQRAWMELFEWPTEAELRRVRVERSEARAPDHGSTRLAGCLATSMPKLHTMQVSSRLAKERS